MSQNNDDEATPMKNDAIFQQITDQIISQLETAGQWSKPWGNIANGDAPHNGVTGRPYSGINWLVLSSAGSSYATNQWLTYKQAQSLGGSVRKGESGTKIIYFQMIENKKTNEVFPMLKVYTVFNADQCENLEGLKAYVKPVTPEGGVNGLAAALGAKVNYGKDSAYFHPLFDVIGMPHVEAFKDKANHDATLLHELTHWTGHKARLDRLTYAGFGSTEYAFEELVAELGAAMAGSILGLPYEGLQHADYIAGWLKVLKSDPKHIYKAAKLANKAVSYMIDNAGESELAAAA